MISLCAGLHRPHHRLADRAAEHHAALQLIGDVACDQVRIQLRLADLQHIESNPLAAHCALDCLPQFVHALTASPDNDARACRMHIDGQILSASLDLDAGYARLRILFADDLANLPVLHHLHGVVFRVSGEPTRLPSLDDAKSKADRVCLVSHASSPSARPQR